MQRTKTRLLALVAALALAAAVHPMAASAQAVPADISGEWTIVSVMAAPWATSTRVDRRMIGASISFGDGRMTGPSAFACGGIAYEVWQSVPRGLFQGGLSADTADRDAKTLGFANPATSYRVTCDTGLFEFHKAGEDLVTAFDNQLLRLRRPGK